MYTIEYVDHQESFQITVPGFEYAEIMAESLYFEHGAEGVIVFNPAGECVGEY